jgi:hypothetical protein
MASTRVFQLAPENVRRASFENGRGENVSSSVLKRSDIRPRIHVFGENPDEAQLVRRRKISDVGNNFSERHHD